MRQFCRPECSAAGRSAAFGLPQPTDVKERRSYEHGHLRVVEKRQAFIDLSRAQGTRVRLPLGACGGIERDLNERITKMSVAEAQGRRIYHDGEGNWVASCPVGISPASNPRHYVLIALGLEIATNEEKLSLATAAQGKHRRAPTAMGLR